MLVCVSLLWITGMAGTEPRLHGSCQLFSSNFPPPPSSLPITLLEDKPRATSTIGTCRLYGEQLATGASRSIKQEKTQ